MESLTYLNRTQVLRSNVISIDFDFLYLDVQQLTYLNNQPAKIELFYENT